MDVVRKVAIMQPYIFPYIGYWQLLNVVDTFIIYDDVNFIKRGWVNRNNILNNGKPSMFTIPLIKASQNKLINEIEIVSDSLWKQKLLKTIVSSYKKAPYFNVTNPMIEEIINNNETNISAYIEFQLKKIASYLNITTTIKIASKEYNNRILKGQDRIIDICIQEKANQYINPIGGVDLYEKNKFTENGIKLNFIKSNNLEYNQFKNSFVPFLSIIDLLMFNSAEEIKEKLLEFTLV